MLFDLRNPVHVRLHVNADSTRASECRVYWFRQTVDPRSMLIPVPLLFRLATGTGPVIAEGQGHTDFGIGENRLLKLKEQATDMTTTGSHSKAPLVVHKDNRYRINRRASDAPRVSTLAQETANPTVTVPPRPCATAYI